MHRFLLSNLFEVVKETRRPIGNELLHIHSFFLLTNNSTIIWLFRFLSFLLLYDVSLVLFLFLLFLHFLYLNT